VTGGDLTLSLSTDTFTNTGTIDIGATRTLNVTSGTFNQTAGATVLNGGDILATTTLNFLGGVLSGEGTITGNLDVDGAVIGPGFSPGILTVVGDLTLGPAAIVDIEIESAGPVPGVDFDQIEVSGTVTLDCPTSTVTLIPPFVPSPGDTFEVLTYGARAGFFGNTPLTAGGVFFDRAYDDVAGTLTLEVVAADPDADCDGDGIVDECNLFTGTPDCNGNGIPDSCDIAGGTSPDCNANGVPDECEVPPLGGSDCNTNGIPDDCDIASGFSNDCQTNGIPDDCELGACCIPPGNCSGGVTQALCLAAGGAFRGPCKVCPTQSVAIIPEPGGAVFVHQIGPPTGCPPPRSALPPRGGCPPPPTTFIDPWVSPEDQSQQTMCHNFGAPGHAIPADFFASGSDPFTGLACLRGVPLGLTQWGEFGEADTLIARTQDPFDRCDLPSATQVIVAINVAALSLEGVDPITVIVNGQPEDWDVTLVDLSGVTPNPGTLTAVKSHCSGGTYTSVLNVQPRFTFTKVNDPGQVRVLDTGLEGIAPITLVQGNPAPWVSIIDPELGATGDPCSDFHAGIEETAPPADCDCNGNLVHDVCDLDCNANAVPDNCDPPGDFEPDADTDLADFAQLTVCFTGACAAPPCDPPLYTDECCVIADHDLDGDVDLDDLADFVAGLSGPH
ncbi:MAG: hypothetical protein GY778_07335, partial [bacterium]|nr:hypothetical protein [bacterium]